MWHTSGVFDVYFFRKKLLKQPVCIGILLELTYHIYIYAFLGDKYVRNNTDLDHTQRPDEAVHYHLNSTPLELQERQPVHNWARAELVEEAGTSRPGLVPAQSTQVPLRADWRWDCWGRVTPILDASGAGGRRVDADRVVLQWEAARDRESCTHEWRLWVREPGHGLCLWTRLWGVFVSGCQQVGI